MSGQYMCLTCIYFFILWTHDSISIRIALHLQWLFVAKDLLVGFLKVSRSNEVLNWLLYFILLIDCFVTGNT